MVRLNEEIRVLEKLLKRDGWFFSGMKISKNKRDAEKIKERAGYIMYCNGYEVRWIEKASLYLAFCR